MIKNIFILSLIILGSLVSTFAQTETISLCNDPVFEKTVDEYISRTVPIISCQELDELEEKSVMIFDTRESNEYNTSHIRNAVHLGYDNPKLDKLASIDKDQPIVVYCSIGYRSEKIGEQLQEMGFTDVRNLYGSIFEWVNQGKAVVNGKNQAVKSVHTYNKKWSKWVNNEEMQLIYE